MSGTASREVVGTLFDRRQPPPLPAGLAPNVVLIVNDIHENHPHLWDPGQTDMVVRLAKMRQRMLDLERDIETTGHMIIDRFGAEKANPLIDKLTSVQRMALSMERALGISFVANGIQLKDYEKKKPGTIASAVSKGGNVRPLRLA
jgi:hypothetical protein